MSCSPCIINNSNSKPSYRTSRGSNNSCANASKSKTSVAKRSISSYDGGGGNKDIDLLGLPQLPEIPQMVLCWSFPGSEDWKQRYEEFNRKVKDFHQAMIDFNWKILEWYSLKAIQLDRFGMKSNYVAGSLVSGPQVTIIYTRTISQGDVTPEVKNLLPEAIKDEVVDLEKTGYKLCLLGKIFIFNEEKVMVIDFDKDSEKCFYRNCLKFILFDKNEKVNVFEGYSRVYGGFSGSVILGGIGGILVSFLTGYFNRPPVAFSRTCITEQSLMWLIAKRWACSSLGYTALERFLFFKLTKPKRYVLSATSGAVCGMLLGYWDNCNSILVTCATIEFATYAVLCNIIMKKKAGTTCTNEGF